MDKQLKKGVLQLCVLSLLSERDMYGYQLYQHINATLAISESTTYPILRKLVGKGLVDTYLEPSAQGPARKYFTLSDKGRLLQETLKKEWQTFKQNVDTLIGTGGEHNEEDIPE